MHPLKEVEEKLDNLITKLERVSFLSEMLKEKIDKLEELNNRVDKLESFNSYVKGMAVAAIAILSAVYTVGLDVIKRVF